MRGSTSDPGDIAPVLRQLDQLVMDAVDVFLLAQDENDEDRSEQLIKVSLETATGAWNNMLDRPFCGVPAKIRARLHGVFVPKISSSILGLSILKSRQTDYVGTHLHWLILADVLRTVGNEVKAAPGLSVSGIYTLLALGENQCYRTELAPEEYFRPAGIWGEITAKLLSRVLPAVERMGDPNQIEAIGPAIDIYSLGGTFSSVSADERYNICQVDFSNSAEEFLSLNVCGHLFHTAWLSLLAHRVSIDVTNVLCPNGRSRLCNVRDCNVRDYQVVLSS
jgi:hypothetical protein